MPKQTKSSIQQPVQERTQPGLILFNSQGKLLFLNSSARQILRPEQRAPLLLPIRSYLQNLHKTSLKSKSSVNSRAVPHFATTLSSGRRNYSLQICLLDQQVASRSHVVAVLLERITPNGLNLHNAKRLFGLSPREMEVIQSLLGGRRDKEIASALGIGFETVRGYLKNIRYKLGVSTRISIVNKLLSS
jgi:DNA-binding CsgD family transcriptional regulator